MTDLHTAAKQALEVLEYLPEMRGIEEAITALHQALANEALDKMADNAREIGLDYEPAQCWKCGDMDAMGHAKCTVPACGMREQPAQQEPVAWRYKIVDVFGRAVWTLKTPRSDTRVLESQPLYTHPQAREWVGLTDEDITKVIDKMPHGIRVWMSDWDLYEFTRAIEAKLKEKNA